MKRGFIYFLFKLRFPPESPVKIYRLTRHLPSEIRSLIKKVFFNNSFNENPAFLAPIMRVASDGKKFVFDVYDFYYAFLIFPITAGLIGLCYYFRLERFCCKVEGIFNKFFVELFYLIRKWRKYLTNRHKWADNTRRKSNSRRNSWKVGTVRSSAPTKETPRCLASSRYVRSSTSCYKKCK